MAAEPMPCLAIWSERVPLLLAMFKVSPAAFLGCDIVVDSPPECDLAGFSQSRQLAGGCEGGSSLFERVNTVDEFGAIGFAAFGVRHIEENPTRPPASLT